MCRLRLWLLWTFRDPYDQFNPAWVAEIEALRACVGDPYVGA